MSAERTKTLWISAAVAAFALVVALAGVFLFAPTRSGAAAPASAGNLAAPKAADPQDYLSAPPPLPLSAEPRQGEGDIIVIYGDKPEELPPAPAPVPAPGAAAGAAATAPTALPAAPAPVETPALKPAAAPKPAAKPAPIATAPARAAAPATVRVSQYWVQTGSFKRSDLAENMKRELDGRGLASHIFVQEINGETWRRIRVGPYVTKAEAEGWLPKIKAVPGCQDALVYKSSIEVKK